MPPTTQRFEAKQQPLSGKWWPLLLFLFGLAGGIIGGNGSKLGGCFAAFCWIAAVISAFICWQKARCEIHTEPDGLNIEVVKAGFRLPLGMTSRFLWRDLEWFRYSSGNVDSNPDLDLKWLDCPILTFEDGDIKALRDYLHMFFPEKEKEAPKITFG